MMSKSRRSYSLQERRELWRRWEEGESVTDIGRALQRLPGTIHAVLNERGGVVVGVAAASDGAADARFGEPL